MESNRDEADKCLELALKFIRDGNKEKAEKFVRKAEKLYPSRRIQEVLNLVHQMEAGQEEEAPPHKRFGHKGDTNTKAGDHDNEEATTSNANYTQE